MHGVQYLQRSNKVAASYWRRQGSVEVEADYFLERLAVLGLHCGRPGTTSTD